MLSVLVLGLSGCAAPSRPAPAAPPQAPVSQLPAGSPSPARAHPAQQPIAPGVALRPAQSPAPQCDRAAAASALGALDAQVGEALAYFFAGRRLRALQLAEQRLAQHPDDRLAALLRRASEQQLAADRALATARAGDGPVLRLPPIPMQPANPPAPMPAEILHVESNDKNLVTDGEAWLQRNHLQPVVLWNRSAPGWAPEVLAGVPLGQRFVHPDHEVVVYGARFGVRSQAGADGAGALRIYDASAALGSGPVPFELTFAQRVGGLLLLQLAYNGYAKRADGRNAYLAAFDAETGRLRWASQPLVGGRANFVVAGDHVISGYGFTREPDFLYVHALESGARVQTLPMDSGPERLLVAGDRLHVRTYDRDYVLRSEVPLPPAGVSPPIAPSAAVEGPGCWAVQALAAVARPDAEVLGASIDALPRSGEVATALVHELRAAHRRLVEGTVGGQLDLLVRPPLVVARPPFARKVLQPAPAASAPPSPSPPPRIVGVDKQKADPVRALDRGAYDPALPFYIAPVQEGRLPSGAPAWIPQRYGVETLRAIIPSGVRTLLIHGGRYLTSVLSTGGQREVEQVLDLEALRHPPRVRKQWARFAVQDVTHAQVVGDTVYVCNGGGSYAREVFGKKGFVTALSLRDGRLLWRSKPLVCNSELRILGDGYLVTGYGFTSERDYLHLLRLSDGEVVGRWPLGSGPDTLRLQGQRLIVECYGHRHVFEVAPPR